MAIFKKTDERTGRDRTGAPMRVAGGESAISIIGPGMQVEGDLVTDGTVRIEGRIRGTVRAGKAVVLGKDGEVVGDVFTQDAVIGGRVHGTLVAESRLELQGTCVVEGQIRARAEHLQLQEGARFNGQIQMIEAEDGAVRALPAEVPQTAQGEFLPPTRERRQEFSPEFSTDRQVVDTQQNTSFPQREG